MRGQVHIVGAGVAGLSAALECIRAGAAVTIHEAAPQAGGRARTVVAADGFAHDNGTHVLFAGNRRALAFIEKIGAREGWIEPEPRGIPVYDADDRALRHVDLAPWSWLDPQRRPSGLRISDVLRLARLALSRVDRPVGSIAFSPAFARSLIEPLTIAVLNTPVDAASSRRLAMVLRRLARPEAARLLVARHGLGPDLIAPAVAVLKKEGAVFRFGQRLRGLVQESGIVTSLAFPGRQVPVHAGDHVILAVPPAEIARVLPSVLVPQCFEPILNVHYRLQGPERPRFIGMIGLLAQWALVRRDHVSVTVSAAGGAMAADMDKLAAIIWRDVAPVLATAGITVPAAQPEARVVKEKRATVRQAAGALAQPPVRPLSNLALAGDWIGRLPATVESAVISGERAVRALRPAAARTTIAAGKLPLAPAGGPQ